MKNKLLIIMLALIFIIPAFAYAEDHEIRQNGYVFYTDGETYSAIIGDDPITWLCVDFEGSSTWYGLENKGSFEKGDRFWVKRINPLDNIRIGMSVDEIERAFTCGIKDKDGNEYTKGIMKVYIQMGTDWDKEDIMALVSRQSVYDEAYELSFVKLSEPEDATYASIEVRNPGYFASAFGSGRYWIIAAFAIVVIVFVAIIIIKKNKSKNSK